ncbi:MAG: dTMP kinase [Bacteroidetes bacterium]|nr:dTMP kinase [Bacteroidota bacterium]
MFISFEGIDFCGKTTQINLLRDYLERLGRKVHIVREPGGTQISEKIREILLNKKHFEMCDETEIFLFSGARAQVVREVIRPLLNEGAVVIADRFHDSTTAYQGFGRGLNGDAVKKINEIATGGTVPDITFYLKISIEESSRRKHACAAELDRIEKSNDHFYKKVIDGYERISMEFPDRIKPVNGERDATEIHLDIVKILNETMNFSVEKKNRELL